MIIEIDTREHKSEYERIVSQFDALGVKYIRTKIWVGDYRSLDNPLTVIDRKQSLLELCSNITQQHERFRNELIRANEAGIHLIILCEHSSEIKSLEDVYFWENPRSKKSPKATSGRTLFRILNTIRAKYGVQFEFCDKFHTGQRIVELLRNEVNDERN